MPPYKKSEDVYQEALKKIAQGDYLKALEELRPLYAAGGPLAEKSLITLLYVLSRSGNESEQIPLLEDACVQYPHDDRWPEFLASIWMNQGDFDQAVM